MKTTLTLLCILLLCGSLFAEKVTISGGGASMTIEISGVESDGDASSGAIIEAIAERLDVLEKEYISQLKRLEQERAKQLISEIFALLVQLPEDQTVNLTTSSSSSVQSTTVSMDVNVTGMDEMDDPEPAPPTPPAGPTAMGFSDFEQLKRDVQAEDFGDDALRVVEMAAQRNHFSVDQIRQLIALFDFSDEQLDALRYTWPKVVDPENSHNLLSAFTYSDDKEQARRIMAK